MVLFETQLYYQQKLFNSWYYCTNLFRIHILFILHFSFFSIEYFRVKLAGTITCFSFAPMKSVFQEQIKMMVNITQGGYDKSEQGNWMFI